MTVKELIEGEGAESILSEIICSMHVEGPVNPFHFEALAYLKRFHADVFNVYESRLISVMGLFYKTNEPSSLLEKVYSIYADTIENETGRKFTPVQASAYKNIEEKKYFSFSAPTSSGKSFLFRELIQKTTGDIVIVLPSRALIAEYMYVVCKLVSHDRSILVLQFVDNVNTSKTKRRIYII